MKTILNSYRLSSISFFNSLKLKTSVISPDLSLGPARTSPGAGGEFYGANSNKMKKLVMVTQNGTFFYILFINVQKLLMNTACSKNGTASEDELLGS